MALDSQEYHERVLVESKLKKYMISVGTYPESPDIFKNVCVHQ